MLANFFALNGSPSTVDSKKRCSGRLEPVRWQTWFYTPPDWAPQGTAKRVKECSFKNCAFKRTTISGIVFTNCTFEDCLFLGARFVDCEFHKCRFVGTNLHHSVFQSTYIDPALFVGIFDHKKQSNIGVSVFQALMRNAEETRQRSFAARAEYHFLQWKRYQLNYQRHSGEIGFVEWLKAWLPNLLYFCFAGYGLRARFFLAWGALFIGLAWGTTTYWWSDLGMLYLGQPKPTVTPLESLYFSVVTIATLGYGDSVPTAPLGMVLVIFEVLAGVLLFGVFVALLGRKVVR